MRHRALTRTAISLIAGAATIGLLSFPAAANTVSVTITAGAITIYNTSGDPIDNPFNLAGTGTVCSTPTGTLTASGTATAGTISVSLASDRSLTIGATSFRAQLTLTATGAYGPRPDPWVTLGGSVTVAARRVTGAGSCTYLSTAGTCTVTASSIAATGTLVATALPTVVTGDVLASSGDNLPAGDLGFETSVSGSAGDCAALLAADDGAIGIDDLEVEAL
jgi:hypothetical protein